MFPVNLMPKHQSCRRIDYKNVTWVRVFWSKWELKRRFTVWHVQGVAFVVGQMVGDLCWCGLLGNSGTKLGLFFSLLLVSQGPPGSAGGIGPIGPAGPRVSWIAIPYQIHKCTVHVNASTITSTHSLLLLYIGTLREGRISRTKRSPRTNGVLLLLFIIPKLELSLMFLVLIFSFGVLNVSVVLGTSWTSWS